MANRNMFTDVAGNQPGLTLVSCLLTFADNVGTADAGSECAVTLSNGFVASVARTAEGIFPVTFSDRWKRCLGVMVGELTGNIRCQMTAQSLNDSTPTVDLTFETGSSGADVDPDGLAVPVVFLMKNSSTAEGA